MLDFSRLTSFSDVKKNQILPGTVFATHKSRRSACVQLCNSNAQCMSLNWCISDICELNSADVHDALEGLFSAVGCFYVGMTKHSYPLCNDKGAGHLNYTLILNILIRSGHSL